MTILPFYDEPDFNSGVYLFEFGTTQIQGTQNLTFKIAHLIEGNRNFRTIFEIMRDEAIKADEKEERINNNERKGCDENIFQSSEKFREAHRKATELIKSDYRLLSLEDEFQIATTSGMKTCQHYSLDITDLIWYFGRPDITHYLNTQMLEVPNSLPRRTALLIQLSHTAPQDLDMLSEPSLKLIEEDPTIREAMLVETYFDRACEYLQVAMLRPQ